MGDSEVVRMPEGRALSDKRQRQPLKLHDKEAMLQAVLADWHALERGSEAVKSDAAIVLAGVSQDWRALHFAADELKKDKSFVLEAVQQHWAALQHVSREMKEDMDVALVAVRQDWRALHYAAPKLKHNRLFILAAVQQHARALEWAGPSLKSDREIVLAAVEQDWRALQIASDSMRSDREIVLAAARQDCVALSFAADALISDSSFYQEVVELNPPGFTEIVYWFKITMALSGRSCFLLFIRRRTEVWLLDKPKILRRSAHKLGLPMTKDAELLRGSEPLADGNPVEWGLEPGQLHELHLIMLSSADPSHRPSRCVPLL